jgi:hypothetical protein
MLGTLYDNNVQKAKDPVVSSNKAAGETVVQHRMRQHLYNEFSIEKSNGGGNTFHQGQEWAKDLFIKLQFLKTHIFLFFSIYFFQKWSKNSLCQT